jgi:hypothetical protein
VAQVGGCGFPVSSWIPVILFINMSLRVMVAQWLHSISPDLNHQNVPWCDGRTVVHFLELILPYVTTSLTVSAVQVATAYFELVACRLNDTEAYSNVPEAWSRLAKLKP